MTNLVIGQKSLKVVQRNQSVSQLLTQLNASDAYLIDDAADLAVGPVKKTCTDNYCKLDAEAKVGHILQDLDRVLIVMRSGAVKETNDVKPKAAKEQA